MGVLAEESVDVEGTGVVIAEPSGVVSVESVVFSVGWEIWNKGISEMEEEGSFAGVGVCWCVGIAIHASCVP